MRNKIAKKILLNIQQMMEFEKFVGGNWIYVRNTRKRVPAHVEKIYSYINEAYLKQKTYHNTLCKVIETLMIAESKKSILRPKDHQVFYDKMTYAAVNRAYSLNIDATVTKMLDYFNSAYPSHLLRTGFFDRNIPKELERIKKILYQCVEQKNTPGIAWELLKKVLVFANSCAKKSSFTERERNFLKKLCKFMVFNEPSKKSVKKISLEKPTEPLPRSPETIEATKEIKKAIREGNTTFPDISHSKVVMYDSSLVDVSETDDESSIGEYPSKQKM